MDTNQDDVELRKTAYHEAGHAVIRYRQGMDFSEVRIMRNPEGLWHGATIAEDRVYPEEILMDTEERRRSLENEIRANLAGTETERYLFEMGLVQGKGPGPTQITVGDDNNNTQVARCFGLKGQKKVDLVNELRPGCYKMVKENWKSIKALAEELIRKETIFRDEAVGIIQSAQQE